MNSELHQNCIKNIFKSQKSNPVSFESCLCPVKLIIIFCSSCAAGDHFNNRVFVSHVSFPYSTIFMCKAYFCWTGSNTKEKNELL